MKEILGTDKLTKTMLCTIDLNGSTSQTVEWAVTLAEQMNLHLTLLYTYRLVESRKGEVIQLKREIEEKARQQFASIEREFLKGKNVSYDFKIEIGFIEDRIEDHAKNNELRFLVVSKNISTKNHEIFDGLMDHLKVPTLVIP